MFADQMVARAGGAVGLEDGPGIRTGHSLCSRRADLRAQPARDAVRYLVSQ